MLKGVHKGVPMAVVQDLCAELGMLDYNCFNKNCLTHGMHAFKILSPELCQKIPSGVHGPQDTP